MRVEIEGVEEIAVDSGFVWRLLDGAAKGSDGLRNLGLILEDVAHGVVGLREVGGERDGASAGGRCFVEQAFSSEG